MWILFICLFFDLCTNPKGGWFTSGCQFLPSQVLFPEFWRWGFFSFWHTVAALEIHCHNKFGFICVTSSSLTPSVELDRLKPLSGTRLVPIEAGVKFGHQRPHFYWKMHELEKKRSLAFRFKDALTELVVVNSKQNIILHVNWASLIWKLLIHSIARSLKSVWCGMDIWPVGGKLFDIPKCCIPFLMYYSKEN